MAKKNVPVPIDTQLIHFYEVLPVDSEVYVGIDPGIEGAITVMGITPKKRMMTLVVDLPVFKVKKIASKDMVKRRRKLAKKKKQKKEVSRFTERSEYDFKTIATFFKLLCNLHTRHRVHVTVEKLVVSMYRPGAKRCMACKRQYGQTPYTGVAVGVANGMWPMLFHVLDVKAFTYVMPTTWKKYFHLTKRDKNAARHAAIKLMPKAAEHFQRVKDHNRAESAMIACYGFMNKEIFVGDVSVSAGGEEE